jgi:hypothetical protein
MHHLPVARAVLASAELGVQLHVQGQGAHWPAHDTSPCRCGRTAHGEQVDEVLSFLLTLGLTEATCRGTGRKSPQVFGCSLEEQPKSNVKELRRSSAQEDSDWRPSADQRYWIQRGLHSYRRSFASVTTGAGARF